MAYKSLTTIVTSADKAGPAVAAAAQLALALDAHLDVLALGIDRTQVGYSYVGGGAVLLQVATERAEADAKAAEAAVRAALDSQPMGLRWT
ncbi:MAG: universal stress protein, partial [Alphaproteobacteria bacterium]|nr:universal stress protein [Alphaproteobacteria bacterium]